MSLNRWRCPCLRPAEVDFRHWFGHGRCSLILLSAAALTAGSPGSVSGQTEDPIEAEVSVTEGADTVEDSSGLALQAESNSVTDEIPLEPPTSQVETPAVGPVDLLLTEDLFPQLRPILLKAVDQAPSILSRNIELAIAEANAIVANSDRYPSVGGVLRYDFRREDRSDRPDINNSQKLYYFFQASYPLYHWGAVQAASEIGGIGVALAEGQLETAYGQLIQSIRSQYLGLVIQKMDIRNVEADLEKRRGDLDFLKQQLSEGEIARNRVGSADFSLQEAQLRYDRQASEFAYSLRRFGRMIGEESFSDAYVAESFPEVGHSPEEVGSLLAAFVNGGFQEDPRVMEAELQIRREEMNYRIHNVRNRPKFNLTTGATQDEISYNANIANKYETTALFVGVALNWSIFDGFETRGLRQASLLRLNRLRMTRQEMDRELTDEARQASERVAFAARALRLGEISLTGVRGQLKIGEKDFAAGLISAESVETARRRLVDYEISQARKKADYLNAVSAFVALVGADALIDELQVNRPPLGLEYERKP